MLITETKLKDMIRKAMKFSDKRSDQAAGESAPDGVEVGDFVAKYKDGELVIEYQKQEIQVESPEFFKAIASMLELLRQEEPDIPADSEDLSTRTGTLNKILDNLFPGKDKGALFRRLRDYLYI
jgi:hypothetical protein